MNKNPKFIIYIYISHIHPTSLSHSFTTSPINKNKNASATKILRLPSPVQVSFPRTAMDGWVSNRPTQRWSGGFWCKKSPGIFDVFFLTIFLGHLCRSLMDDYLELVFHQMGSMAYLLLMILVCVPVTV